MPNMDDAEQRIRQAAAKIREKGAQAERQRQEESERHQEMQEHKETRLTDAKSMLAPFKSRLLEGIALQDRQEADRIFSHDSVCLHGIELYVSVPQLSDGFPHQWAPKLFNVFATSHVILKQSEQEPFMAASLWYCDAEREGEYNWYQIAFATSAAVGSRRQVEPFGLDPNEEDACLALSIKHTVVPLSFEVVNDESFTTIWKTLFALALEGKLDKWALDQWPNQRLVRYRGAVQS